MRYTELIIAFISILAFSSCGGDKPAGEADSSAPVSTVKKAPAKDLGVGPITKVDIPDTIDVELAAKGKEVFTAKCTACHKIEKRFVGPALAGVTDKQEPEWIMNMILNPEGMVKENVKARELLMEFTAPMANQHLTEAEARSVYEYFRTTSTKSTK